MPQLALSVDLANGLYHAILIDFARSRPVIDDMFMGLKLRNEHKIQVGHMFQPLGMEGQTGARFLTFWERGPNLGGGRNVGIMYASNFKDAPFTYRFGIFQPTETSTADHTSTSTSTSSGADDYQFTGRVTYLPMADPSRLVHLGLSASHRLSRASYRFRPTRPFAADTVGNTDTGDDHTILGLDAATIFGPLSFQGEYMAIQGDTVDFSTVYVYGSYFLTQGDQRTYDKNSGLILRTVPKQAWGETGYGAVEVGVKIEAVDFDDGQEMTNYSAGVNWYLSRNSRIVANVIHSVASDGPEAPDEGDAQIFGLRFHTEF